MKVFKFGGASVRDAEAIKNVGLLIEQYAPKEVVVVVSAMGKTTNALEEVVQRWYAGDGEAHALLAANKDFHNRILRELFGACESLPAFSKVNYFFEQLEARIQQQPSGNYDYDYDQIASTGELAATTIIGEYLYARHIRCHWQDARRLVITDDNWREGNVDWNLTQKAICENVQPLFTDCAEQTVVITQGFIGGTSDSRTTTLGREGSDYTAAIFSHVLNADEMVVWKDVEGILNADPKIFDNTVLLPAISYGEAIELTYYGATVIHPKTIKPLQNKNIPLRVRSFLEPGRPGTRITAIAGAETAAPSFIVKTNQMLISIAPKNFSFIAEQNLSDIFAAFASAGIHINMMQNSAISFTACITDDGQKTGKLFTELKRNFTIKYNSGLQLITIRHWTAALLEKMTEGKTVLLEQRNRTTAQMVLYDVGKK